MLIDFFMRLLFDLSLPLELLIKIVKSFGFYSKLLLQMDFLVRLAGELILNISELLSIFFESLFC